MNKRGIILVCLLCCSMLIFGQNSWNLFHINNYRNDLSLSLSHHGYSSFNFSAYGSSINSIEISSLRYLFQSQEYDPNLDFYMFPSRFYDPKEFRFITPDPKSQYVSPYTFVGADPINYVDIDGKIGKPLIIYGVDARLEDEVELTTQDLLDATPDAYHLRFSDFINGEVGDLSEWNGNVFIKSHIARIPDKEFSVEYAKTSDGLKTKAELGNMKQRPDGSWRKSIGGKKVGRMLRDLGDERGVAVKSVTVGGCHGAKASKAIHEGFTSGGSSQGRQVQFLGLKDDKNAVFTGPKTSKEFEVDNPLNETRFYTKQKGGTLMLESDVADDGTRTFAGWRHTPEGASNMVRMPEATQSEVRQLVNGRVPGQMMQDYEWIFSHY